MRSNIITTNFDYSICITKIRINDPRNNRGKSAGFRVYSLLGVKEGTAVIFHIYPKTGANRQDNLSDEEKKNLQEMINDLTREDA